MNLSSYPQAYVRSFLVVILSLGVLITTPAQAQESSGTASLPLEENAWALQFGVGENFSLDSFLGSTISAKKHTSPARAWQFGLTLDARVRLRENDPNRDEERIQITARYIAYPLLGDQDTETIQLFLGAGPLVEFRRNHSGAQSSSWWGVGVSGTIGAEWFVHPRIGLTAAYEPALRYQRLNSESENTSDISQDEFHLHAGGGSLGVSVYF